MKIYLGSLAEGTHTSRVAVSGEDIGLDDRRFPRPIDLQAVVDSRRGQSYIKLTCSAEAALNCDRCLDVINRPLIAEVRIIYSTDAELVQPASGEAGSADEFLRLMPADGEVDLADDARQALLLRIPMQVLCRDDCAGLCPACGINRNCKSCACISDAADPRWAALKNLKH